ncbi:MAG: tetratricopeptide repeat protein [Phycisphaerae bacterium]
MQNHFFPGLTLLTFDARPCLPIIRNPPLQALRVRHVSRAYRGLLKARDFFKKIASPFFRFSGGRLAACVAGPHTWVMPSLAQLFDAAARFHQSGQLAQAENYYRQILKQEPNQPHALHLLGLVNLQLGRQEAAIDLIRQAISAHPSFPEAWSNLAIAYRQVGRTTDAVAALKKSIALRRSNPEAHNNLGALLVALDQTDEAIASFRQALVIAPNYPEALNNLGNALRTKGHVDEAIEVLQKAVALRPNYAEALNALGIALAQKGNYAEAGPTFQKALALAPDNASVHTNLGNALREKGDVDAAAVSFRRAIALSPNTAQLHANLANVLKDQGLTGEAIAASRKAVTLAPKSTPILSNLLFNLHFDPDATAHLLYEEHRAWAGTVSVSEMAGVERERVANRRVRVGYLSPDLREHPVGRFLLPLLMHHDRQAFEVFAYSAGVAPDEMTEKIRAQTEHWRDIATLSDEDAAKQIRKDGIDILVDLAMHAAGNRILIFARKPAPVQMTWLAYCSTTGLPQMDYRVSDPYLDPVGTEADYSEETLRLNGPFWCYQPVAAPAVTALPAKGKGYVTFGSLNSPSKLTPPTVATWLKLLAEVPNSRLLLHIMSGELAGRIREMGQREGIAGERIETVGRMGFGEYLEAYGRMDIGLDPFPYGGGTTTCDALYMGVPVVTLRGQTGVGRGGSTLLQHLGMQELVAGTREEYVRIAAGLAGDLGRLAGFRAGLRGRMEASLLMDGARFARSMEGVFREALGQG